MKEAIQVIFCHLVVIIIYVPLFVISIIVGLVVSIFKIIKEDVIDEIKGGRFIEIYHMLFDTIARKITRGKYEK